MDFNEVLARAKTGAGVTSDYAFAKALGVARNSVSRYRNGIGYPDPVVCEKLANFSGIPLNRVLGIVGEARAISAAEKKVWRRLAAAIFVSMLVALPASATNLNRSTLCTLCVVQRVTMRVTFWIRRTAHRIRAVLRLGSDHGYGPAAVLA